MIGNPPVGAVRPAVELVDPVPPDPRDGRRARVLGCLREVGQPLSLTEVAERTGVSASTVRFHLAALVADGLVGRAVENRAVPGRPRVLYSARAGAGGPRSYRLLAEMLAGLIVPLAGTAAAAVEAGRRWGRQLVQPAASGPATGPEAVAAMNRLLDGVGFRTALHGDPAGERVEIRLRHCPFREVAERHPDVVCALHLGLMQGALEELAAPVTAGSLDPFVTPDVCVAHLQPTGPT